MAILWSSVKLHEIIKLLARSANDGEIHLGSN